MQRHRRIAPGTLLSAAAILLAFMVPAQAETADPWRIAIVFAADGGHETESAGKIARHIGSALTHGPFIVIDPGVFPAGIPAFDAIPRFADWRAIRAEALMIGHLAHGPNGRLRIKVRVWSTYSGMQILGKQYSLDPGRLPELENVIVEAVSNDLTQSQRPSSGLVHFPR
jgi:Tol biopolymer transport system component